MSYRKRSNKKAALLFLHLLQIPKDFFNFSFQRQKQEFRKTETWKPGIQKERDMAAVSCSPDAYRLGGVGFGFWLTGKLGHAWVGAWVSA